MKIESLTPEQEALMPVYRDRWIAIGCSTDQSYTDADCERALELVNKLVLEDGDPPLKGWVLCDSPIDITKKVGKNICLDSFYGNHDCTWISFYAFFEEVCGVEVSEEYKMFKELSQLFCWQYVNPDDLTLYLSRKPVELHMENGLLHNESGPSILFADGFSVYSIDGHHVTEQIVMSPETLTLEQIHSEQNADIQSIMVNRFAGANTAEGHGWVKYITQAKAKLVDSRHNDIENTVEALYDTGEFGLRLICTCPTGRVFSKGVQTASTCQEAQDWLSGFSLPNRRKFRTIGRT